MENRDVGYYVFLFRKEQDKLIILINRRIKLGMKFMVKEFSQINRNVESLKEIDV